MIIKQSPQETIDTRRTQSKPREKFLEHKRDVRGRTKEHPTILLFQLERGASVCFIGSPILRFLTYSLLFQYLYIFSDGDYICTSFYSRIADDKYYYA